MKHSKTFLWILFLITAFVVGFFSNKQEVIKTKTETVIKYDTITKIVDNTKPTKIEKVVIEVPKNIANTQLDTVYIESKQVTTNKYTYIDTLENGLLKSTIWADKIFKRSIELTTFNKETKTTTTNTVIKNSVMLGVDTNINSGIQQTSLNLYFVRGDKWLVKGGLGYDIARQSHFYSVGLAIKF